ncbi:sugar ABC transporter permease [Salipaludibacillus neizhouensis]|uniref:Sugar ABC transporter permease n=1 Tax=Salipaludibacillus neizhouensis TaxID=885475 RepID=A0A3A9K2X5_9BACI|nr:carbohydrate ABC transporter permease [Salipaludibacillus neizhouensis]RKL67047.1 sugar ABC transporter permease [Salipaludibacillus neizhouensis]
MGNKNRFSNHNRRKQKKDTNIVLTSINLTCAFLIVFPIIWLLSSSFKPSSELFAYPLSLFPEEFTIDHYIKVIENGFFRYIYNSFFLAVVGTLITVAISSMCGYALAIYRHNVKYTNIIFGVFLLGTLIPGETLTISQFTVISELGLYNNIWGVIFPVVTTTTGIFLYRQFYLTVPTSFVEAARIDGAGEFYIFSKIMLPLSKSVTITLCLFSFMWRWNDYILPLLVLSDQKNYTIQIAIKNFIGANGVDWNSILAGSVISIIPITILFLILQKYITGINISSGDKG